MLDLAWRVTRTQVSRNTRKGLFLALAFVGFSTLAMSCEDSSPTTEWKDVLLKTKWQAQPSVFAEHYRDDLEAHNLLQTFVPRGFKDPCAELFGQDNDPGKDSDFWYLAVNIPAKTGAAQANSGFPALSLRHVKGGKKVRVVDSLEATVLNVNQGENPRTLSYQLDAWFPATPVSTVECNANASVDSAQSQNTCICEDSAGNRSTCSTKGFDSPSCCVADPNGEKLNFKAAVTASYCARACQEPALLGKCAAAAG